MVSPPGFFTHNYSRFLITACSQYVLYTFIRDVQSKLLYGLSKLASSIPGMPQCDEVYISLMVSCWFDTVSPIALIMGWWICPVDEGACMADSESMHMTPHCREFCVMCCVASRIACSSAENIEEDDDRARCWMIASYWSLHSPLIQLFWIHWCKVTVCSGGVSVILWTRTVDHNEGSAAKDLPLSLLTII